MDTVATNELSNFWLRLLALASPEDQEQQLQLLEFKKGDVVFRQGSPLRGVYFIREGKVKCMMATGDGMKRIIGIRAENDFIGYKDVIFGNSKNSNTIEALENLSVIFIDYIFFKEVLADYPRVSRTFFKLLSKEMLEAENHIVGITRKPVNGRVVYALLWLESYFKEATIPISRTDIGNIIGTATETAIRMLSELKKEKIIGLNRRDICILDKKRLQQMLAA